MVGAKKRQGIDEKIQKAVWMLSTYASGFVGCMRVRREMEESGSPWLASNPKGRKEKRKRKKTFVSIEIMRNN